MSAATLNRTAGIPLRYANRHGLITGATGTGKTVSLMRLVEQFSQAGVPVFVADVKGDIAALSRSCPCDLLDLFGAAGRPVRATVDGLGADLLARSLELNDTQAGTLEITLHAAGASQMPVNTLADLRTALGTVAANRESISSVYGQVSPVSISVIQRALLRLEKQGGTAFFGTPAFDVADLLKPGQVSILAADRLMQSPRVYGAFLLWMLSDLYERLPEVGDMERPRLVYFFDEAHLLFRDCPAPLLRRIEQTVRLIRSKGVGVYFVTQSPDDVPPVIREQLAHRLEHDRALPVGTARFATIDDRGRPVTPHLVKVDLPGCQLGALSDDERQALMPARPAGQGDQPDDARAWDWAIVLGSSAVIVAALGAAVWQWQAGNFGVVIVILLGLLAASKLRPAS